jgi:hypothetical protein
MDGWVQEGHGGTRPLISETYETPIARRCKEEKKKTQKNATRSLCVCSHPSQNPRRVRVHRATSPVSASPCTRSRPRTRTASAAEACAQSGMGVHAIPQADAQGLAAAVVRTLCRFQGWLTGAPTPARGILHCVIRKCNPHLENAAHNLGNAAASNVSTHPGRRPRLRANRRLGMGVARARCFRAQEVGARDRRVRLT